MNTSNRHCSTGVSYLKQMKKFRARINVQGVTYILGYFDIIADAESVYTRAKTDPEFARIAESVRAVKLKANAQIRELFGAIK